MKVNNEEYQVDKYLSGNAYNVSKLNPNEDGTVISKNTPPLTINGSKYQVVYTQDNSGNNGFQGLAVAPIKNGQPDYSHTTIAYAGTDASGELMNDGVIADGGGVVGGLNPKNSQFNSAESFYKNVSKIKGVKVTEITGHSLGGALAQKVAATHHVSAMTFSSADVSKQLNSKERQWLLIGGKQKVINIVHYNDVIAQWTATQGYGTTLFSKSTSTTPVLGILSTHMLNSYPGKFKVANPSVGDFLLYHWTNNFVRQITDRLAYPLEILDLDAKIISKGAGWFKKGAKLAEKTGKSILSGIEGLFVTTASADTVGGKVEVDKDELDSVANALLSLNNHLDSIDKVNQNIMSDMDKIFKDVKSTVFHTLSGMGVTMSDLNQIVSETRSDVQHHVDQNAIMQTHKAIQDQKGHLKTVAQGLKNTGNNAVMNDQKWANAFGKGYGF